MISSLSVQARNTLSASTAKLHVQHGERKEGGREEGQREGGRKGGREEGQR